MLRQVHEPSPAKGRPLPCKHESRRSVQRRLLTILTGLIEELANLLNTKNECDHMRATASAPTSIQDECAYRDDVDKRREYATLPKRRHPVDTPEYIA